MWAFFLPSVVLLHNSRDTDSIKSARTRVKDESSEIVAAHTGSMTHREPLMSSTHSSGGVAYAKPVKPSQHQRQT